MLDNVVFVDDDGQPVRAGEGMIKGRGADETRKVEDIAHQW
jgi:hypothetical protein